MSDYIDEVFGPGGFLAARFENYEPRAGQIDFARAVDASLRDRVPLFAEAPTGTGKSLAYGAPAAYHASQNGRRVVIATANIALQEQLVKKDLPLLQQIMPWRFNFALLKGLNNYLCYDAVDEIDEGEARRKSLDNYFGEIYAWAQQTRASHRRGDISELSFEPAIALKKAFFRSGDDCTADACEYYPDEQRRSQEIVCCGYLARQRAQASEVVVVNYHLFFADLNLRAVGATILPDYDAVILDEGHKTVEIARDFFGDESTQGSVDWTGNQLRDLGLRRRLSDAGEAFYKQLLEHRRSKVYSARIKTPGTASSWEVLRDLLSKAGDQYRLEVRDFVWSEATKEERLRQRRLSARLARIESLRRQIASAMLLPPPAPPAPWRPHPDHPFGATPEERWYWDGAQGVKNETQLDFSRGDVHYIEEESSRARLCTKPISVAGRLRRDLFETTKSVVVTSATLTVRGSYNFAMSEVGMSAQLARSMTAASPFNWREQALLVLPQDVPDPSVDLVAFNAAAAEKCAQVIDLARGRVLGLFTSHRALDLAYLRARQTGHRILKQGDMPRTRLIDEFRRDVSSVLLGTESLWAGVDVQGESLSCVFIDKLPFIPKDDPILDAISERDNHSFMNYSIPKAIIALKQGFGRLIRTQTDKGAVVVLDSRITTKFYGRHFIESLPPVRRSRDITDVRRFLDGEALQGEIGIVTLPPAGGRSAFNF